MSPRLLAQETRLLETCWKAWSGAIRKQKKKSVDVVLCGVIRRAANPHVCFLLIELQLKLNTAGKGPKAVLNMTDDSSISCAGACEEQTGMHVYTTVERLVALAVHGIPPVCAAYTHELAVSTTTEQHIIRILMLMHE
jgi:hypothetical protein